MDSTNKGNVFIQKIQFSILEYFYSIQEFSQAYA